MPGFCSRRIKQQDYLTSGKSSVENTQKHIFEISPISLCYAFRGNSCSENKEI